MKKEKTVKLHYDFAWWRSAQFSKFNEKKHLHAKENTQSKLFIFAKKLILFKFI